MLVPAVGAADRVRARSADRCSCCCSPGRCCSCCSPSSAAGRGPSRSAASMEMRRLSAFFLDMLRGIATLKMFGRSREQVGQPPSHQQPLRRHHHGRAAHRLPDCAGSGVGATVAIALVAVEVEPPPASTAASPSRRALAVLHHHARVLPAAAGSWRSGSMSALPARRRPIRTFAILDEPAPVDLPTAAATPAALAAPPPRP